MMTARAALTVLWSACSACQASSPSLVEAGASRAQASRETSQRQTDILSAAELFSRGKAPVITAWESDPARLRASYCGECHQRAHGEWAAGMHGQAWQDPLFQRAFRVEPQVWCRNCHAPLDAQAAGDVPAAEGINCAACHVRQGQILGSRARPEDQAGHAVRAVVDFGGSALCAGCHQFPFPDSFVDTVQYSAQPMQDTVAEWSRAGGPPCASCHARGHRLLGPHDAGWLEAQFGPGELRELEGVLALRVELAPRAHALPTGDPFRSLVLEVAPTPSFSEPLLRVRYGREFAKGMRSDFSFAPRTLLRDTSVPAHERALHVSFDRPPSTWLYARLLYLFHDSVTDGVSHPDFTSAQVVWSQTFRVPELDAGRSPELVAE